MNQTWGTPPDKHRKECCQSAAIDEDAPKEVLTRGKIAELVERWKAEVDFQEDNDVEQVEEQEALGCGGYSGEHTCC